MDALIGLIILVLISVPVILIWLAFSHVSLRRKVEELTGEVNRLRSTGAATTSTPPSPWQAPKQAATAPPETRKSNQPAQPVAANAATPPPLPTATNTPPKSFVFATENVRRLVAWIKENWFIAIAALSLAMAGIFLVQYGIEQGILSPRNRVLSALVFGVALIGAGEWIRRRTSDEDGTAAYLPSTFAGAGVATLFSAVMAAQQMYGLIGKEAAFIGLVGLAGLSVVLGWLYGPFLTVIGLTGAVAAPFIVSDGTSVDVRWLFYFFALISAVGLGVDAMKRSAWVSALGLIIPYIGATLVWLQSGSEHFVAFAALVAISATCIPTVQLRPAFTGAMSYQWLNKFKIWPEFPTRLSAAGILSLALVAIPVSISGEIGFWASLTILSGTLFLLGYWLNRTAVLDDLALPVAASLLACIGLQGLFDLSVASGFAAPLNLDIGETTPRTMSWLVALGLGISALAGWRSLRDTRHALAWASGAAVFAPATVVLLSMLWSPLVHLSTVQWAAHAIGVSVLMTVLAEQALRRADAANSADNLRVSLFALAALNMIAFAMSIVLTETALTLGFAGVAASAAWLDRKFDIRPVSWFAQLAILLCSFRIVMVPGLGWAIDAPLYEAAIGFIGTIALIAVAWFLLQHRQRTGAMIVAESAIWSLSGIFLCILLFRALDGVDAAPHWSLSLFGTIWLISAAAQLYRVQAGGVFENLRMALGAIFGTIGLMITGAALTFGNPLVQGMVSGPPIFDSLMVAYLLPAVILGAVAWRFTHLSEWWRIGAGVAGGIFATAYVGFEIRRLWQGSDLTGYGVVDGELYSYTIAMLLAGSVTLGLALTRKSALLRRGAVAIIALTIAKVFLIDMSGLEGLIRVLSFLALGLVLAGLALLNRWVSKALEEE